MMIKYLLLGLMVLNLACDKSVLQTKNNIIQFVISGNLVAPKVVDTINEDFKKYDPLSHTYTLKGISLLNADSKTDLDLGADLDKKLRVIDRPEIYIEIETDEYDGNEYTGIEVVFDAQATLQYNKVDYDITLANEGIVSYTGDFTISKSIKSVMTIDVNWKNTVYIDSDDESTKVLDPEFEVTYK